MSTYYQDPKITPLEREEWEADIRGRIEQIRVDARGLECGRLTGVDLVKV